MYRGHPKPRKRTSARPHSGYVKTLELPHARPCPGRRSLDGAEERSKGANQAGHPAEHGQQQPRAFRAADRRVEHPDEGDADRSRPAEPGGPASEPGVIDEEGLDNRCEDPDHDKTP